MARLFLKTRSKTARLGNRPPFLSIEPKLTYAQKKFSQSATKVLWDSRALSRDWARVVSCTQNCLNGHFGTLLMLEKIVLVEMDDGKNIWQKVSLPTQS